MLNSKAHSQQLSDLSMSCQEPPFLHVSLLIQRNLLYGFDVFDGLSDGLTQSNVIFNELSIEDVVLEVAAHLKGLQKLVDFSIRVVLISRYKL